MSSLDTDEEDIIHLVSTGDWQTLLSKHHKNRFLPWIWPSVQDLQFIAESAQQLGACRIVSIGCGSGLLEWFIRHATGMEVKGVEVDSSWWHSKHSTCFLELIFADDFIHGQPFAIHTDALLFCYFNNEPAFLSYLDLYEGSCLIVIGPGEGRGTHTVPTPFMLPPPSDQQWMLHSLKQLNSGQDYIGVYKRRSNTIDLAKVHDLSSVLLSPR